MDEVGWMARIDVAVTEDDVDRGGRLKGEACSLWAVMALESVASAIGGGRMVSMNLELGSALSAPGVSFVVGAEITKQSRALAFVAARAADEEGRMLFTATGVFGLAQG
jgi:acyl-coenzyme A thioesterase PaaI-like protein